MENEETAQSVLHGLNIQGLSYSPLLQRQMKMEVAPEIVATPMAVPQMGLGGGAVAPTKNRLPKSPTSSNSDGED